MVEVEPQEGMRAVSVHFTVTASGRGRGGGGQVFGWPEQADAPASPPPPPLHRQDPGHLAEHLTSPKVRPDQVEHPTA